MPDIVELRLHHLFCILNYGGAGYTPEFIANMSSVIDRINEGASIRIVSGIDDICGALWKGAQATCAHAHECRAELVKQRDQLALKEIARVLEMPTLKIGSVISFGKRRAGKLRRFFAHNAIRQPCVGCEWHERCSQRAANKYVGARLFPPVVA